MLVAGGLRVPASVVGVPIYREPSEGNDVVVLAVPLR